jgi:asparaginyl-tRNA synthetase
MKNVRIVDILKDGKVGSEITVKGWVRTRRSSKNVNFIALNDGSTINNLQVVADVETFGEEIFKNINTGAAISATGKLLESVGSGQSVELKVDTIEIIGPADPDKYPLQPKRHSLEFLREIAHLRPRTATFSAIFRIRHAMIFAIHQFFHDRGFYNIHTPIITSSDAEGAGEMFRVTTLPPTEYKLNEEGKVDFSDDFFGKSTNLTVSGQLEGELFAMALSRIYTFGPTFRAENSNTSRHLAEFWMIEPEVAFFDLNDNMDLAEEFLKYLIRYALENCMDDLLFLRNRLIEEEKNKPSDQRSMDLIEKLRFVADNDFVRLTYTQAIEILKNSKQNKKGKFQYPITGYGADLQSEHERFLVEQEFKKPVILTNYPKEIKAFYMRLDDNGQTVSAMDVLFPQIGEIIGGSQREERLDVLERRMDEMSIPKTEMQWYLDTRRFGGCPHAGFGLGFERLMLFVTGMGNIRDVIPFARTPKNCEF